MYILSRLHLIDMDDLFSNKIISSPTNTEERNRIKLDVIKPLSQSELDSLLDSLHDLNKKFDLMISVNIYSH
jgi:hypothetical protein